MKRAFLMAVLALWSACAPGVAAGDAARDRVSIFDLMSTWTDQDGRETKLSAFEGRVTVLAMFFSHCTYACPLITADMKSIRAALPDDVRPEVQFVMVSFDALRDFPPVLKAFGEEKELDWNSWTLLHGEERDVRELAAALNVRYRREADGNIAHSNIITILAPDGSIAYQREGLGGDLSEMTPAVMRARGEGG